jgi:succinyl-diaminopimelate desuccinylase
MEIKVLGKSVHSGLSHLGVNAVEKAVPILEALLTLKAKVTNKQSSVPASPDTGLVFMVPRLNINMIQAGLKVNIIPDECVIQVDRRLIPEENLDTAEEEIRAALAGVPEVQWQAARLQGIPTVPPCRDKLVDELAAVLQRVAGQSGQFGEMGSGDLGPIAHFEWGAVEFGLGVIRTRSNIHGRDEFVFEKDIEDLAAVITEFIRQ